MNLWPTLSVVALAIGVTVAIHWLMAYTARGDVGNGGHRLSLNPLGGFDVDTTVSAYARRAWQMAREASRHGRDLATMAETSSRTDKTETVTRTGG